MLNPDIAILAQSQPQVIVQESKDLKDIIARLNER